MARVEDLRACLPKPPAYAYDWAGLGRFVPLKALFEAMARTPQHPAWHGEGDVWTHTRMVCQALSALSDFRAMPDDARDALALAALLHDIGKPRCTRPDDQGRLTAPHHGPVGAKLARSLLWREFGLCGTPETQRFREAVCLLIRYHTKPLHILEADAPETRLLRLASNGELTPLFTLKALCLLAEADRLGSVADDNPEQLDKIRLARELAGEAGCLERAYPFASTRAQRALFTGGRVWKDQILFDGAWGEVILLCGLPGTGKDTWIRTHHPELPTVSLDDLRREMGVAPTDDHQRRVACEALERARGFLRAQQPFIWNATSLTSRRGTQISLFENYHARSRVVYLETDWAENLRRNASRPDAVPEGVLHDMLDRLEPPERFEAQAVDWLCV